MDDPRVDIQASLERASNYNGWIADQIRANVGKRVLDAGCGSGNLTRMMLDKEQVVAVDVWPDFVETMSERFADADNLAVHRFDLSDPAMADAMVEHRLDSAYCCNVLEHVEDDGAALTNLARCVGDGGTVFLLVPAFMALYGEHDRADHHFRRYTKRSLEETVAPLPLEIERSYYMNMPGFFAWFLLVRLMRRTLNEGSIGFYDRIIPAIRRAESRRKPPFGQSLVAVMRSRVG